MLIVFSIWAIINVCLFLNTDADIAAVARKNAVFSWGIVYSVIFHFVLACSGILKYLESKVKKWVLLVIIYVPALINIILYYGDTYTANELIYSAVGWVPSSLVERGFLWDNYFNIYYVGCMLASIGVLIFWRTKTNILREIKQANLLLLGFVLAFILASVTEIILPINGYLLPFGSTLIVVFLPLLLMLYSVNKYGFLSFGSSKITTEIMSISNEGIVLCDTKGGIQDINNGALSMLGITNKASILNVKEIGISVEQIQGIKTRKTTLNKSDGTILHTLISSKTLYDSLNEKYGYLIMFLDIEELETAQQQLKVYADKLEFLVAERTKQLREANKKLSTEIVIREKSEQENIHIAYHDFFNETL